MSGPAFKTPPLPQSFRGLRADGYRNIYELSPGHTHLYATETLCGDWDGDLLILAQDFAPAAWVEARVQGGHPTPYVHWPEAPTNRRIVRFLTENGRRVTPGGESAADCGVLYGSACFLLKGGAGFSGPLRNRAGWWVASAPVFRFTMAHMPRLTDIACLGKQAYDFVLSRLAVEDAPPWRAARDARRPVVHGGLRVWAQSHPGGQGVLNRLSHGSLADREDAVSADWRAMFAGAA